MSDPPVISIVTPSYNQGEFLEETLVSVLSQAGDFHLDYLVIDGESTDASLEIIHRYADLVETGKWQVCCRSIRLRWLSEPDNGQSDALMKGFNLAEGDILAWLNSDDVYLPGALQVAVTSFRETPSISFVYADAHYCDVSGNILGRHPVEDFNLSKLAYFNYICQPSTFFRKEAFVAVGGLDISLHYGMDYDLFVKLGKRFPCLYLPKFLSKYRLHDNSKTMRDDILLDNHQEGLTLILKHFNWAPINRVFGWCHYYCLSRLPPVVARQKYLVLLATVFCTLVHYVRLNRGLRWADLKLLTLTNFRKIFRSRSRNLQG